MALDCVVDVDHLGGLLDGCVYLGAGDKRTCYSAGEGCEEEVANEGMGMAFEVGGVAPGYQIHGAEISGEAV